MRKNHIASRSLFSSPFTFKNIKCYMLVRLLPCCLLRSSKAFFKNKPCEFSGNLLEYCTNYSGTFSSVVYKLLSWSAFSSMSTYITATHGDIL